MKVVSKSKEIKKLAAPEFGNGGVFSCNVAKGENKKTTKQKGR